MSYLDDYVSRINDIGLTPSDYYKNMQQDIVDNGFEDSPTIVLDGKLNGVRLSFRVSSFFNRKTLTVNPDSYQKVIFKDIHQSINIGDILEFNNFVWICYETSTTELACSCLASRTNNSLLFYPPTSLTNPNENTLLCEIPAIIGKGSINLSVDKFISLASDEYMITCPNNIDSSKIDETNRFILGAKVYKILGIDDIGTKGLLEIKVKEDLFVEDDNRELGIANYFSNQHTYSFLILNNPSSSLNKDGDILQINTECKLDEVIIPNPIITYSSSDLTICTVSSTGLVTSLGKTGLCTITAVYDGISASISVNVVIQTVHNYSCIVNGNDLKYGMQNTYNAVFANSGDPFNINTIWEVKADDGISSTGLATITSTNGIYNENCILKSNSTSTSNIGQYVRLYASSLSPAISNYKRIKIISLI